MHTFSIWVSGLIALIGSLIANAIVDTVFFPMTGVPESVMTFNIAGPVGAFTTIGVIGATIVYAVVRKLSSDPNKVFIRIAAVVLIVSFLPDLFVHNLGPMFAAITTSGAVLLMAMHILCAAVTVTVLTKLTRPVAATNAQ